MKIKKSAKLLIISAIILTNMIIGFGQKTTWKVETAGAMREMFATGNVEGKTQIGKIPEQKNLYGVGPLENLSGEIMVWNGKVLTSFLKDKTVKVETNPNAKAVFFVWANVEKWREILVPESVKTYDELEKFIAESAEKFNLNSAEPFPFLMKGKFQTVEWHINDYKPDGAKLTHEKHDELKYKAGTERENLEFLGFYSPSHKGVFTHHTRTTHIHATDRKKTFVGHVDDLKISEKVILFLPVK